MISTVIVEDENQAAARLSEFLSRYGADRGQRFRITVYDNAASFLEEYRGGVDLVFMDIQMPGLNGMDAARLLREKDREVQIVFVTSLMTYAVSGYEVGALDYIVKPFEYKDLALRLGRALLRLRKKRRFISFSGKGLYVTLDTEDIRYLESVGHKVIYHLANETLTRWESLTVCQGELPPGFVRCNSCYVVNLEYVRSFDGENADVDGQSLRVSKPRRAAFRRALAEYEGR